MNSSVQASKDNIEAIRTLVIRPIGDQMVIPQINFIEEEKWNFDKQTSRLMIEEAVVGEIKIFERDRISDIESKSDVSESNRGKVGANIREKKDNTDLNIEQDLTAFNSELGRTSVLRVKPSSNFRQNQNQRLLSDQQMRPAQSSIDRIMQADDISDYFNFGHADK